MKTIAETAHGVWYNKKVRHETLCFFLGLMVLALVAGIVALFQWLGKEVFVYFLVWTVFMVLAWLLGHIAHFMLFKNRR